MPEKVNREKQARQMLNELVLLRANGNLSDDSDIKYEIVDDNKSLSRKLRIQS